MSSSSSSGPIGSGSTTHSGGGRGRGVARVLAKLETSLSEKNYYEAHQMYNTLYFRYVAQGNYTACECLLYEGALKFFTVDENGSGSELAKLYLQVLEKGKVPLNEELFKKMSKLYSLIPHHHPEKNAFLSGSLKLSDGHPRLHQLIAHHLWDIKSYNQSRQHFLHSTDGTACGTMLVEFHQKRGYPRELDLFVVGTVLQYLCLRKHLPAARALVSYTQQHPLIKDSPPFAHPLLNFVWLLLLAIETKQSLSAFSVLIEKYKPSLKRDPCYLEYLDKIGQTFFGLPPPKKPTGGGGMFSGLFDSLLNVLNEPDDEGGSSSNNNKINDSPKKMETEDLD